MAGMGISSMVSVSAVRSPRVIEEEVAEEETDLMVFPFFVRPLMVFVVHLIPYDGHVC